MSRDAFVIGAMFGALTTVIALAALFILSRIS